MAHVSFEDAIAEMDNVVEDSYTEPIMFRKCSVSDLNLVLMIAPKGEHESVLRVRAKCVSLPFITSTFCSHSCECCHIGTSSSLEKKESSTISNRNIHSNVCVCGFVCVVCSGGVHCRRLVFASCPLFLCSLWSLVSSSFGWCCRSSFFVEFKLHDVSKKKLGQVESNLE